LVFYHANATLIWFFIKLHIKRSFQRIEEILKNKNEKFAKIFRKLLELAILILFFCYLSRRKKSK